MRWWLPLLLLLPLPLAAEAGPAGPPALGPTDPGLQVGSIESGGRVRTWLTFVPMHHHASEPCPLMIVLHGGGGSAQGMASLTDHGFQHLLEQNHLDAVVVYPEAVDKNWHDDRESIDSTAVTAHIDDVAFIRAMIRSISASHAIAPDQIYATGISNGALFCYRLAREAPEIAAIAPVAGLLPVEARGKPWPRPVSVLVIQGTADPLMPFHGGMIGTPRYPRGEVLSLDDTVDALLQAQHLAAQAQPLAGPTDTGDDPTTWRARSYGTEPTIAVFEIIGGGHTWPGGRQYLPEGLVGRTCHCLDACQVIWDFCSKHHRQ